MKKFLAAVLAAALLCGGLAVTALADEAIIAEEEVAIAEEVTADEEVIAADEVTYKVTYNGNGNDVTGVPAEQDKVQGQTLTLRVEEPARPGHKFKGWAAAAGADAAEYSAGGNYTADAAATLYAVWQADTFTVKYRSNAFYGVKGMPSSQTKVYGQTLTLSAAVPTRWGFTFAGWATSPGTDKKTYDAGASYTANEAVTLYATWTFKEVKLPSWWADSPLYHIFWLIVWFCGFGWIWMK